MLSIILEILFFLLICQASHGQRRIEGGKRISTSKPYVVYLVKAPLSQRDYDFWLCGGALVTTDFIITSAACIEDVQYLYAIAGYEKYITEQNLELDPCTKKMKKKVIFTCLPISYHFDFDRVEKWSTIDIALARVESPYDFEDTTYLDVCKYIPNKISINYDPKYQVPDTDCMVLGWGHDKKMRKTKDRYNYNSRSLLYSSTLVINKDACTTEYQYYPKMKPIIEQYMICTSGESHIDDAGQPTSLDDFVLLDGCEFDRRSGQLRRTGQENSSCNGQIKENTDYNYTRRAVPKTNRTYYNYTTQDFIKQAVRERRFNRTRRNGICQNDHGGPVVTWVGSTEVLIGVASVFQIDNDYNCIGPFLHTSTQANSGFIDCVLNNWGSKRGRRSAQCDSPPNIRGFDTVENHISWKDHPAGPAENELLESKFGPYNDQQNP